MVKYRFWEFKNKDTEDYCRADYLSEAKEIFKRFYGKKQGLIKEIWMSDYDPVKLKKLAGDK